MSEQKVETTTIVRDGNTIIIAHPPVKKQTDYWELFTGLFKSDSPSTQIPHVQSTVTVPIEPANQIEVKVSTQPTVIEPVSQSKEPIISEPLIDWKQVASYFSKQSIASYRNTVNTQIQSLEDVDVRLSNDITKFKEENILTLGDIRVRSILMAFSSAVMYKLISANTTGLLRKTRNLGVSFVFMGYWFAPELFNPFLRKPSLAQNIL